MTEEAEVLEEKKACEKTIEPTKTTIVRYRAAAIVEAVNKFSQNIEEAIPFCLHKKLAKAVEPFDVIVEEISDSDSHMMREIEKVEGFDYIKDAEGNPVIEKGIEKRIPNDKAKKSIDENNSFRHENVEVEHTKIPASDFEGMKIKNFDGIRLVYRFILE